MPVRARVVLFAQGESGFSWRTDAITPPVCLGPVAREMPFCHPPATVVTPAPEPAMMKASQDGQTDVPGHSALRVAMPMANVSDRPPPPNDNATGTVVYSTDDALHEISRLFCCVATPVEQLLSPLPHQPAPRAPHKRAASCSASFAPGR
eukprot:GHVU01056158.1.p1 GENE.GHVU01056158.1~~GHVU01056158.1.p1  ORF type:complete len:150 (+),score=8.63 GHVU01056158.1:193-642(+)